MRASDGRRAPATTMAGARARPLLSGEDQDRAVRRVEALLDLLVQMPPDGDPSLSAGSAGVAMCWAFVSRARSDARAADRARAELDAAIDALATQPLSSSLYAGFPGIAWAAEAVDHLLGDEAEDRGDAVDEAVLALLERYPDQAPYDLINGLVGLGVYAFGRLAHPGAAHILTAVVNQLDRRARRDATGVSWWTSPSLLVGPRREQYPHGGVDLGVAHGIGGVIPFLARAHRLAVNGNLELEQDKVRALLDGAVAWLLSHTVATPSGRTVPYFVAEGEQLSRARTAWCYGDPGVACALMLAARDADEPAWADVGTDLALSAARRPPPETGVTDAGLCHGSGGLVHVFTRLYEMTGEPELRDAALAWADRTLALTSHALTLREDLDAEHPAPWNGRGVLEGLAGVVLALTAACADAEPSWDQMLLVSTTGASGIMAP